MKYIKKLLILGFHSTNLVLIIFYLYPGSIFGCYLYNNCYVQPQITKNFIFTSKYLISSNNVYVFIILSFFGMLAYQGSNKVKFLIAYLFSLAIMLFKQSLYSKFLKQNKRSHFTFFHILWFGLHVDTIFSARSYLELLIISWREVKTEHRRIFMLILEKR